MRRRILPVMIGASVALLVGCGGSAAPAPSATSSAPVRFDIGYPADSTEFSPLYIAEEEGVFRRNGLDAQLHLLRGSASETPALLSGDVQAVIAEANVVLGAVGKGADVVYVACDMSAYGLQLWARPSLGGVPGLKGKRLALAHVASLEDSAAHELLAKFAIDPQQVQLQYLGDDSESIAALIAGRVDAASVAPPQGLRVQGQGFEMVYDLAQLPHVAHGLLMTRAFEQGHPSEVTALLKSYIQAIAYAKDPANRQKAMADTAKYVEIKDQQMLNAAYDYYVPLWQSDPTIKPADLALSSRWVADHSHVQVDLARAVDLGPLEALEKAGFVK